MVASGAHPSAFWPGVVGLNRPDVLKVPRAHPDAQGGVEEVLGAMSEDRRHAVLDLQYADAVAGSTLVRRDLVRVEVRLRPGVRQQDGAEGAVLAGGQGHRVHDRPGHGVGKLPAVVGLVDGSDYPVFCVLPGGPSRFVAFPRADEINGE